MLPRCFEGGNVLSSQIGLRAIQMTNPGRHKDSSIDSSILNVQPWTLIAFAECPGHVTLPSTLNAARCFKVRRQWHLLITHLRTALESGESCMFCILSVLNARYRCRPRIQGLGSLPLQRASHFSVCHY